MKKLIISLIAIIAIILATWSMLSWQKKMVDQPNRQESELGDR